MLGGTCLGFANAVAPGRVAVVAAAGTGAQEAATLLDRGAGNIAGYATAPPHGIAVPRLAAWARAMAADAEAGRELDLRPPRLRA